MDSPPAYFNVNVDLGLSPMQWEFGVKDLYGNWHRRNGEAEAFNDTQDLVEALRGKIAQMYVWLELWR